MAAKRKAKHTTKRKTPIKRTPVTKAATPFSIEDRQVAEGMVPQDADVHSATAGLPDYDEQYLDHMLSRFARAGDGASMFHTVQHGSHEVHEAGPLRLGNVLSSELPEDFKFELNEEWVEKLTRVVDPTEALWDDVDMDLLRASPAYFAAEILQGPPQEPYNGHFLVGDHHVDWDELVTQYDRLCVLASRDHGKTYFFDFAYPLWQACFNPNKSGYIFSATKPQAERIMMDIQTELETNPKLAFLLPQKGQRKIWRNDQIRLSNGHTIYARGFGTKVRGAHPHWIVVDDGLTDEALYSEITRTKQIDYFLSAITNMIVPGGQILVVGTPFHKTDLYGHLKENPEYHYAVYRALIDDQTALWPDRYDIKQLMTRRREIGSIRFTREFMCDPISDDMSLFPDYLFRGEGVEQPAIRLGAPKSYWAAAGIQLFMAVDFAMSTTVKADYSVIWVMGIDKFGNRWIADIIRFKGAGFQKQLSLVIAAARKYDPELIYIEANQMQRIFGDELIRTTDLPIVKFVTTAEKNSLEKGVPSLSVLLENKKVKIPRGDARSVEITEQWIDEMRSFTWHAGKLQGVGANDDTVMACWICDQAIRRAGYGLDGPDGEVDLDAALQDTAAQQAALAEMSGKAPQASLAAADQVTDIEVKTSSPGALQAAVQTLDDVFAMVRGAEDADWQVTDAGNVIVRVFGEPQSAIEFINGLDNASVVRVADEPIAVEKPTNEGEADPMGLGEPASGAIFGAPAPGAFY